VAASYRDSLAGIGASSTISVNPAGLTVVTNDVVVLHVFGFTSIGAPSGSDVTWTERLSDTQAGPFSNTDIHKVYTGVAPDASLSSFTLANGQNDTYAWVITSVQDGDTTTPVDASGIDSNTFSSVGVPTSPSISPTGSDSLLLCACGWWPSSDHSPITFTPPTGMTEREEFSAWEAFSAATLGLSASGATGTKAFTESPNSPGGTEAWIASSIAIKSAEAGAAYVPNKLVVARQAVQRAAVM
jgi:hypothetical protein